MTKSVSGVSGFKRAYGETRAPMSPQEKAKQARRVCRAIQQGVSMRRLVKGYGVSEGRVREIAAEFGVALPKPRGGNHS